MNKTIVLACLAIPLGLASSLIAKPPEAATTAPPAALPAAFCCRLETWEVPALEILRRMDSGPGDSWLPELRRDCLSGKLPAKLIQSPVMAATEQAIEYQTAGTEEVYPTDYEAPQLPNPAPATPEEEQAEMLRQSLWTVVPSIFETRNTGVTFKLTVQPAASSGPGLWDVSLDLEEGVMRGMKYWLDPALKIIKPDFASNHLTQIVTLKEGEWRLLTVAEPTRPSGVQATAVRRLTIVRLDRAN